jgi:hypothetical protein
MVRDMTAVVAAANRGIGYEGSMVRPAFIHRRILQFVILVHV